FPTSKVSFGLPAPEGATEHIRRSSRRVMSSIPVVAVAGNACQDCNRGLLQRSAMALGGLRKRLGQLGQVPAFAAEDHRNTLGSDGKQKLFEGLNRKERRLLDKQAKK